ncbi:type II restriction endonuclease [Alistipes sp. An116]|nr:type II restriction endonuclease [Alistipes sp. An116]
MLTQNIAKDKFAYIPILDFTSNNDINWSKSIPEIDQQLYLKYHLTDKEIAFIEKMIKAM